MARRSTTSTLAQIIYIDSVIPWWVSLTLAPILYFYLNSLAVMPEIDPKKPMGHLQASMVYCLSYWLRYVIPLALILGSIRSLLDARKRVSFFSDIRTSPYSKSDLFATVSWRKFEMLVGQFFRERGYKVHETGGATDGGIDLRITASDFKTYLVQCKHWKTSKVPVNVVRVFKLVKSIRERCESISSSKPISQLWRS
ncbi:MAG: restriction endonuclease [Paraglaciecola sp.]|uniref:restriction endonuclease n=1 Tax=Paraglaciecola sp. TaxID=1920173 RepID=UPI00273D9BAB|nr:restriction endonuclease [Paraglaciecola sp.]MDP5030063.1 restriction endonuclease [Paraglaciecola sp.]MDP5134267.1 restriction endonuclease [Paraglaciecola sp.]